MGAQQGSGLNGGVGAAAVDALLRGIGSPARCTGQGKGEGRGWGRRGEYYKRAPPTTLLHATLPASQTDHPASACNITAVAPGPLITEAHAGHGTCQLAQRTK